MAVFASLRRAGVAVLGAAVLAAAAVPAPSFAAPGLAARAGAEAPDADAVRLAEIWADVYFSPEQISRNYAGGQAPPGFPPEWIDTAVVAARETVVAVRPRIVRLFAEIMQTVGTPAERHAGADFLSSPVGRRMLKEAAAALTEKREMDMSDADKRELMRRMDDPLVAGFISKMGQIDDGLQARQTDLMRIFVPGMFRRWGEKMEALPRPVPTADEKVGAELAAQVTDVEGFLEISKGPGFDDLSKMATAQGMPENWGRILVEEMLAVMDGPGRADIFTVVGRAYARHMSPEELRQATAFFATPAGQEAAKKLRSPGAKLTLSPSADSAYSAFLKSPAGKAFAAANDAIYREALTIGTELGVLVMPATFRRFGARLEAMNAD